MQSATQRGLATVKYVIDTSASRFTVQAFATGVLSAFGHNPTIGIRNYDGEIEFIPETWEKAHVRVNVQTSAMEVLDEMKSDDRKKLEQMMYENILEVKRFPIATYASTEMVVQKLSNDLLSARVSGDLTFHEVTHTQSLDARVTDMGAMLRVSGEFTLLQSSFGIKPLSIAGGGLKLKDELKFTFELVARKQE
jgi:polyisoprenoid-binding protein YceI